jgi:hypothetical protein
MDIQEILNVAIPNETRSYKPLSHGSLIDATKESCDKLGFVISNEKYITAANGNILTGYYDLDYSGTDNEMGIRIAFQNSYNKQVTVKFSTGSQVMVCSNGSLRGDIGTFKRKHVSDVQTFTPITIQEHLKTAVDNFEVLCSHKNQMKQIEIGKQEIAQLIGDMYINESLIKETQLAIIKREIENPSYNYNSDNSLWQVYNHITHSLKSVHAANYIDTHGDVHQYICNRYSLV